MVDILNVSTHEENCAKIFYCLKNIQSYKFEGPILGHLGHHGLHNDVMWRIVHKESTLWTKGL